MKKIKKYQFQIAATALLLCVIHRVPAQSNSCRCTRGCLTVVRENCPDVTTQCNECADNIVVSAKCGATFLKVS